MLSFYFPPLITLFNLALTLSKFWHSTCRKLDNHEFVGNSTHRFNHLLLLLGFSQVTAMAILGLLVLPFNS